MSGLREAFDEIVADVPVYGDLDRAIEQAERERRHRYGVIAGLAAVALVTVIVGVLAVTARTDSPQPIGPSTPTVTPTSTPSPAKSQSPRTWVDTPVARHDGYGWDVPDPLKAARDAWLPVVAEHLDPQGGHLQHVETSFFGAEFDRPVDGLIYPTYGHVGLIVDGGQPNPDSTGAATSGKGLHPPTGQSHAARSDSPGRAASAPNLPLGATVRCVRRPGGAARDLR